MNDVDKEIDRLINNYSKLDLAQMVMERDSSIETLNEIIGKMKRCGNCEYYLCDICNLNDGADVCGEHEPCEKWKITED